MIAIKLVEHKLSEFYYVAEAARKFPFFDIKLKEPLTILKPTAPSLH
jgi:hypothetical protein